MLFSFGVHSVFLQFLNNVWTLESFEVIDRIAIKDYIVHNNNRKIIEKLRSTYLNIIDMNSLPLIQKNVRQISLCLRCPSLVLNFWSLKVSFNKKRIYISDTLVVYLSCRTNPCSFFVAAADWTKSNNISFEPGADSLFVIVMLVETPSVECVDIGYVTWQIWHKVFFFLDFD